MQKLPENAVFNGRTVKPGDRVKCYFAQNPWSGKWHAGTIECFLPFRFYHPKRVYDAAKPSGKTEIIVPENEHGWITYDDYRYFSMYVRTDERADDRSGRLFDGFGICCTQTGPVILESEKEYDPRPVGRLLGEGDENRFENMSF